MPQFIIGNALCLATKQVNRRMMCIQRSTLNAMNNACYIQKATLVDKSNLLNEEHEILYQNKCSDRRVYKL